MKTLFKKLVSVVLVLTMVFSLSATAFAAEPDINQLERSMENITLDINKMTPDEYKIYKEVMDATIKHEKSIDPNFNEQKFVSQVNGLLYSMEYGIPTPMTRSRHSNSKVRFSIPNNVVATTINVAVSLLAGGGATATIKALVSKYGAKTAANMIAKKVTAKLLALGIKEASGLGTVIRHVVKNVLDPGDTVAEWLDSKDKRPRNGYVDVSF